MKTMDTFKKYSIIAVFLIFTGLSATAQKTSITAQQLPATAQDFLKKHFTNQKTAYILKDAETFSTDYKVQLENGIEIEFDKKGNWEEVDGNKNKIPFAILPKNIATYVTTNYKNTEVVKIEKGNWDYEVKLNNGLELKFNAKGEFLRLDD